MFKSFVIIRVFLLILIILPDFRGQSVEKIEIHYKRRVLGRERCRIGTETISNVQNFKSNRETIHM